MFVLFFIKKFYLNYLLVLFILSLFIFDNWYFFVEGYNINWVNYVNDIDLLIILMILWD